MTGIFHLRVEKDKFSERCGIFNFLRRGGGEQGIKKTVSKTLKEGCTTKKRRKRDGERGDGLGIL